MKNYIKKYKKYHPSIQDIITHIWVNLLNPTLYLIWGTTLFNLKAILFGVKKKGTVKCYGQVHISRNPFSTISFGKNVTIVSSSFRGTASSIFAVAKFKTCSATSKIIIEDNVGLNGTSIVARSKTVHVGSGTMIAPNVTIVDSDFHALWPQRIG